MSLRKVRFLKGAGLVLAILALGMAFKLVMGISPVLAGEPLVVTNKWTLQQDETVSGMYLNRGTVDLNGHVLMVEGNLIQAGGTLYVHGGTLRVTGDYRLQTESGGAYAASNGYLKMTDAADCVIVDGRFVTQSNCSHVNYLTAGVLEVKGDFTELAGGAYNFAASGTHKVLLSGEGLQTVQFGLRESYLNLLEIRKTAPDGLRFEGLLIVNNLICHGYTLPALKVAVTQWILDQDLVIDGQLTLTGGTLDLAGHELTIYGSLLQPSGTVYVHGGRLHVTGDYRLQTESGGTYTGGDGILKMTDATDYILVEGTFVIQSSVYNNFLRAGVLEIKGDFMDVPYSRFIASDAHKVLLSGDCVQTIQLGNGSKFYDLEIQKTVPDGLRFEGLLTANNLICHGYTLPALKVDAATWDLDQDLVIDGQLTLTGGSLDLAGHRLTIRGSFLQPGGRVSLKGGRLYVMGDYRLQGGFGGDLDMIYPGDYVRVDGELVTEGQLMLGGGVLEVKGNFTQLEGYFSTILAFNHKTLLSGPGVQTVSLAYPPTDDVILHRSRFATLVITKPLATGYTFLSPTPCWDSLIEEWNDATPPTTPANLAVAGVTANSVSLTWAASTDNILVAGYEVYRDGVLRGTTDMPYYTDTGLASATTYAYYVRAYDTRNNYSANSNTVTATTEAGGADIIPPVTAHDYQYDGQWRSAPAQIHLTATDEGGSGVKIGRAHV